MDMGFYYFYLKKKKKLQLQTLHIAFFLYLEFSGKNQRKNLDYVK